MVDDTRGRARKVIPVPVTVIVTGTGTGAVEVALAVIVTVESPVAPGACHEEAAQRHPAGDIASAPEIASDNPQVDFTTFAGTPPTPVIP